MRSQKMENSIVLVYLEGRIDSANAPAVQKEIDEIMTANPGYEPVMDAGELSYISSAGLRVLLQVTKSIKKPLTVQNVTPEVYDIFGMTGFTDILDVKKKLREFHVEGCEVVGKGAIGTVYRVDDDTIVKVYEIPDSLPMIENEQKRAKQAFLKGIPTAISYDVVKVGDKYGSVFEMLKASTYNDLIVEHPEQLEDIVKQYTKFVRQLHSVEMDPGELPEAKQQFLGYLDELKETIPEELWKRLQTLFESMKPNLHVIHGDVQMKNVMLSENEPLLIDMDTLSVGNPVFDLMGLYVTYVQFNEEEPDNTERFLGIPKAKCDVIWQGILHNYFEGMKEEAILQEEKKIIIVGLVRFLQLIAVLGIGQPELKEIRIRHAVSRLQELTGQVDTLEIDVE